MSVIMRSVILSICFFVAAEALDEALVNEFLEKIAEIGAGCAAESKATSADIALMIERKLPTSHEGKCMLFCFHKAFNIQNEDGTQNTEGALVWLNRVKESDEKLYEKMYTVHERCQSPDLADKDPCVYASNLAECAVREGTAIGLADDLLGL